MPFDLDRVIDHQLYLATQRCLAPYLPGRASVAITGGHGIPTSDGRSSLGSLLSPWAAPLGSGSGSGSGVEEAGHAHGGQEPQESSTREDYSPFHTFVTAPVGALDTPVVSGRSCGRVNGIETGAGRGVAVRGSQATAPSKGKGFAADTAVPVDGIEHRSPAQPQPGQPRHVPPLLPPLPPPPPPSRPPEPSPNQPPRIAAIDLLVDDLPLAKHFYQHVFSIEPVHEDETTAAFCFNDDGSSLMVNLYASSRAGGGGRARAGGDVVGRRFQLSVVVDDVDAVYARLRGLEGGCGADGKGKGKAPVVVVVEDLTGPRMRPWDVRTVTFRDPSGYCWEVAEEVG